MTPQHLKPVMEGPTAEAQPYMVSGGHAGARTPVNLSHSSHLGHMRRLKVPSGDCDALSTPELYKCINAQVCRDRTGPSS